jgi:hypothetical protein
MEPEKSPVEAVLVFSLRSDLAYEARPNDPSPLVAAVVRAFPEARVSPLRYGDASVQGPDKDTQFMVIYSRPASVDIELADGLACVLGGMSGDFDTPESPAPWGWQVATLNLQLRALRGGWERFCAAWSALARELGAIGYADRTLAWSSSSARFLAEVDSHLRDDERRALRERRVTDLLAYVERENGRALWLSDLAPETVSSVLARVADPARWLHVWLANDGLDAPPAELSRFTAMQTLDLSRNRVTRVPEWLAALPALRAVVLSDGLTVRIEGR